MKQMMAPTISDEFRNQHYDLSVGILISGLKRVINYRVEDVAVWRRQLNEHEGDHNRNWDHIIKDISLTICDGHRQDEQNLFRGVSRRRERIGSEDRQPPSF